jgi:hypothetical protein
MNAAWLRALPLALVGVVSMLPVVAAASGYSAIVTTAGPIAYWRLNDATTSNAGDSVGGHTGHYGAGATLIEGATGDGDGAAQLDGHPIQVGGSGTDFNLSGDFAIEAWAQLTAPPAADMPLISHSTPGSGAGSWTVTDGPSGLSAGFTGSGGTLMVRAAALPPGGWHEVIVDSSDGTVTLYVDGKAAGSATGHVSGGAGGNLEIGGRQGAKDAWTGGLDDVAVFRHSLSSSQVTAMALAATALATPPPAPSLAPTAVPTAAPATARPQATPAAAPAPAPPPGYAGTASGGGTGDSAAGNGLISGLAPARHPVVASIVVSGGILVIATLGFIFADPILGIGRGARLLGRRRKA